MQKKFHELQNSLSSRFLEREDIISATIVAMVAGEHVLFLGPPGTAKSQLARSIAESIRDATYFEWLLTRFSTPEEIFGPISLKALQQDRFERITVGKLPHANICFLDEIFKASSAILNSLLSAINERVYHNNGRTMQLPLISLIGASNELPQADDLTALYDRFLIKFWVDYVGDGSFRDLLSLTENSISASLSLADLEKSQEEAANVKINDATVDSLEKLRAEFAKAGIRLSDRKWRKSLKLIKAVAWLDEQDETAPEHLDMLKHVSWSDINERAKVARIVACVSNPFESSLLDAEDSAREIFDNAIKAGTPEAGAEANQKFKLIQKQLDKLAKKNPSIQAMRIKEVKKKITNFNRRVVKEVLGFEEI